jgi:hypothetical protein
MDWAIGYAKRIAGGWNQFWFDSRNDGSLVTLAAFRVLFCLVMLVAYLTRAFDVEFFYSAAGILPNSYAQNLEFFRYHPSLITDGWSLGSIHALHALFLVCLFCQMIGFGTRFAAVGTYLLHMVFVNRNMSVMFGVDMIATFFLLYLCFARTNARFSVDAMLGRGARTQSALSHVAMRLMQLQVCVIYGFSGTEKLKGTRWWDGSALWDVLSIGNMQRWDMSFVAHFPVLLAASVYIVLAWEIYFPALIWQKSLRLPMLFFGVLMHIGIFVFMNLPSFGFMMISLYFLFLKPEEILDGLRALLRTFRISRPIRN